MLRRTRGRRTSGQSGASQCLQYRARSIPPHPHDLIKGSDSPMTVQVSKTAAAIGGLALDTPIFDPHAFRLDDEQAAIVAQARELGQSLFAGRAAAYDRDATFPTEN